jgi:membrane-bound serine protease (ClpP class)
MNQNIAFLLLICGALAIYGEFIWPGRVLPGLAGAAMALTGGYFLWRNSPSGLGLELLAAAAVLLAAEALLNTYFIAGVMGTAAAASGFCKLFAGRSGIAPGLAIPLCLIFGAVTIFLSGGAKRARRNKRNFSPAGT